MEQSKKEISEIVIKFKDGSYKGYNYQAFKAIMQQHFYARYSLKEPTLEEVYEEIGIKRVR